VQHNEKDEFFIADNAFLKTNFAFKKSSEFINQIAQTEQPGNKKFNKKFAEAEWLKRYVELQNNIQDYLLNKDHSHENITQLYLDAEYSDNTDSIEQKLLHPDYVLKTRQYLEDYLHTHRFRIDRRAFNWSSSPTGTIAQALKLLSESIWTTQEAIKFLSNLIDINYRLDITNEARRERCEQRQLEILVFLSKKYPSNEGLAKRIMAFKLLPFVESYRTNSLSYNFINCAGVADYLNGCIEDKPNRDNTNYIIENLSKNIGSNIETRKNVEIWLLANKELEAWKIFRNYAESVEGDGDSDVFMVKYIEEQIRQPDNSASASALMLSAYLLNMSTDRSAQMLCIEAAKHSSSTLAVAGIIWLSWGKPDSEKTLELLKELTINGHLADIRQNAFYCILIHFGKEKSVWSFLQKISTIETDSEVKKWINFWLTGDSPVYFKNRPWFRPQFHLTLSKAIKDYETIEFQLYCEALEANNIDASKITL
jgi:hypothetical protein